MRRSITFIILLFLLLTPLSANRYGLSIGLFDIEHSSDFFSQGTHAQIGLVAGLAPRWESEVFLIGEVTPHPLGQTVAGAGVSFAILGSVYEGWNEVPLYANAYFGVGFMSELGTLSNYGPYVRITPISVGGPQFRLRERGFTFGTYYNIPGNSFTLFWNVFLLDFFSY